MAPVGRSHKKGDFSVRFVVMGIVHEKYFLVFPVDPVHQDRMPDVQAPVSFQRFFEGLADLRV